MDKHLGNGLTENNILDNFTNVFTEYQMMREFVLYRNQNMCHIYVVPSHSSTFVWFGVMFVHKGLYRGIVLRFHVLIPNAFPTTEIPKIVFDAIPFHPLINPLSGELNTSLAFTEWKSSVNNVWEVIDYANRVFNCFDLTDCLPNESLLSCDMFNTQAVDLYRENMDGFRLKVTQTIRQCNQKINEYNTDDSNAIIFGPFDADIHQELQRKLLSGVNVHEESQLADPTHPSVTGLSWVQSGSTQMFSKSGA
ncbi:unnamed protein product [Medioppia subpectinata]|uniref:UBC core domain-containing protein n=1 Tax=Medioppia subpectinata TaxID=1979941 RepID=A0A7R9KGB7_9ACAR|nr:unnamed protein product [Medioppia subpectinata]CAG2102882.1 unnamed protein product [Medioppia subpectinata]